DVIADDIHKLERRNIFEVGDLLLEARSQCEHGEWMNWLEQFDWSWNTATRYADVAELGSKFCKLKNLKLAASTLYALVEHDNEDDLPSIIEELARHASKKQLSIRDAEHVIRIGIGRHRYGDHPDATLVQLVEIEQYRDSSWYDKAVAELKEQKPETDESA